MPNITSRKIYIAAMHEVGHYVGPWQDMKKNTVLETEAGAWLWARENVKDWSESDGLFRRECLQTYLNQLDIAKKRGIKRDPRNNLPLFPEPDSNHIIWKMMADDMA